LDKLDPTYFTTNLPSSFVSRTSKLPSRLQTTNNLPVLLPIHAKPSNTP